LLLELSATEGLTRERKLHELAEREHREFLWIWEASAFAVVLGRSCNEALDVDEDACRTARVPIVRRESGGGTVLLGPGCLNYTLILSYERRPRLRDVTASYGMILDSIVAAVANGRREGTDLTLESRKFGGSAQKRSRSAVLHHGTILYDFDMGAISKFLREPKRQPPHRQGRSHDEFMTNVPLTPDFPSRLAARFPEVSVVS
jgi:lipoate---protein ligase